MKCHGCLQVTNRNDFLNCNSCKATYCFQCLGLNSGELSKISQKDLASIGCPSCSNVTHRKKNTDETLARRGLSITLRENSFTTSCPSSPADVSASTQPLTLETISALLDQKLSPSSAYMTNLRTVLKEDIKQMVATEMTAVVQTLKNDFSATTDFICAEQADLKASIVEKDKKIKHLEKEQANLESQISSLNNRLVSVENVSRSRNLEIQAVPESRSENLLLLLKSLCQVINSPILESDIHACRRVAKLNSSSERPRNILVTLSSPRMRDNLISAVHRYNKSHPNDLLNSSHLGLTCETRRIFVSEHLSPELKQLHAAARKAAKELGFKYVWVRYGRVYMRKDDSASALQIKNMDSLAKLR